MNVSLTEKLEDFVKSQVKGGDYNNSSEVVREALRLLSEQKKQALIKEIEKGLKGPFTEWNAEDFNAEMKRKFAKKKKGA